VTDQALYSREGDLTAADVEQIEKAILGAYPNKDFLYVRMAGKWGIRVADDITDVRQPGRIIVHDIVEFARSEGRLLDLLGLAWSDKPQNPKLRELADAWLPDQSGVLAKYGAAAEPPPAPASKKEATARLEKQVDKHSRLVGMQLFIDRLELLSQALCRVHIPAVNGTGFLIGSRFVLTNYHVVEPAIKAARMGDKIACEFDYFDTNAPSVTLGAKPGVDWLRLRSPYSPSDLSGVGEPNPGELDFALIELNQPVEATRKSLPLPFAPPIVTQGDYIVIGQHPGGEAAQIAVGQVVSYPGNGLRYRYTVTTEPGSSGSPVLDMDLTLVGLHHAADPAADAKYNQGVPIWRIKEALEAAGVDLAS